MNRLLLLLPLLLTACGAAASDATAGASAGPLRTDVATAGDTIIVTSHGESPVVRPDTIVVLWRSDRLDRPQALARAGDRLIVGDRTSLHVVPLEGGEVTTIGREGGGPGEFRIVGAVGAHGDTLLAWDDRQLRLSMFGPDGELLGSAHLTPPSPYANRVREAQPLVMRGDSVLLPWSELLGIGKPMHHALVLHDLASDGTRVLGAWPDVTYIQIGPKRARSLAPRDVVGPRAVVAIGTDGRIATGDGVDYCVDVWRPEQAPVRRVCREWTRASVGDEIRSPDLSLLDDPARRQVLGWAVDAMEVPELMPSYDRVALGSDGSLWVHTLGEAEAHVHPWIAPLVKRARPAVQHWDDFDGDGALVRTVELPAAFTPFVFAADRIEGVLELDTGELVIAEARLGPGDTAARPPTRH